MDEGKTVREQGKLQRKDKNKVSCGVTLRRGVRIEARS